MLSKPDLVLWDS